MQSSVKDILARLKSANVTEYTAAMRELAGSTDPLASEALKKIQANHPDPALRDLAGQLLNAAPNVPAIVSTVTSAAASSAAPTVTPPSTPINQAGPPTFQMLWDCRFCGTKKLLGIDHRHCPNCGAAQDPAWRYFPSEADKKTISDPKYTYAGADKICPFCNQPNSAAAKFCKDCGGDLANAKEVTRKTNIVTELGQDIAGVADDVVLERFKQQQTAIKPQKKAGVSKLKIGVGVFAFVCIALIAAVFFLSKSTYAATVTVTDLQWQRVISIEKYTSFRQNGWQDSVPGGAYDRTCYSKDRPHQESYTEACGVERVDKGDGSYTEHEKTCTRSRTVHQPDTYCDYSIDRWVSAGDLKQSGGPNDALVWPNFSPSLTSGLGAERESARQQTLSVLFKASNNKPYTYKLTNMGDEATWQAFKVGQQYDVSINRLEVPEWQTLKLAASR